MAVKIKNIVVIDDNYNVTNANTYNGYTPADKLTSVFAGTGLTGGGNLTTDKTISVVAGDGIVANTTGVHVNSSVVRTSRILTGGNGIAAIGDLSADRTITVIANSGLVANATGIHVIPGTDIVANATGVHVGAGIVRTTRNLTAGVGIAAIGDLSADRTISVVAGADIIANSTGVHVGTGVVRSTRALTGGNGIATIGDLSADRTISVVAGDGLVANATGVHVNSTVLRNTTSQYILGNLSLSGAAATPKSVFFQTSGLARFGMGVNGTAETGLNEGSDFYIQRFDDTGVVLATPIFIDRSSGAITLSGNVGIAAGFVLSGNGAGLSSIADAALPATIVRTSRTLTGGNGIAAIGDLSVNRTISVVAGAGLVANATGVHVIPGTDIVANATGVHVGTGVVRSTRNLVAGNGIGTLGNLSADRTISVVAGADIVANSTGVHVGAGIVRTTRNLVAGNGIAAIGDLSADRTITVVTGDGLVANATGVHVIPGNDIVSNATGVHVGTGVVRTIRNINTSNGLTGGGDLSADKSLYVVAGSGIVANVTGVHVDSSVVRNNVSNQSITGNLTLNQTLPNEKNLILASSGLNRFAIGSGSAEGGANLGSDLFINSFNDAGAYLATPLIINRSNSHITLSGNVTIASGRVISGNGAGLTSIADAALPATIVRTSRTLTGGNGIAAIGDLSVNRTITVIANSGLVANATGVHVIPGTDIVANATGVHVGSGIVRTTRNLTAGNGIATIGNLSADRTISVVAGSGLVANATGVHVIANSGIIANATGVYVDGTVLRNTGDQTVTGGNISITGTSGVQKITAYQTGGLNRFSVGLSSGAETGSNVGSDFYIRRFDDAGVATGLALSVKRDNGLVSISQSLSVNDDITVVSGQVNGNGAGLTSLNGTNITTGTIADARIATTLVRQSVEVQAGNGLIGGGTLAANRSFRVGPGDGITVTATTVAVDSTVLRTNAAQEISSVKTFTANTIYNDSVSTYYGTDSDAMIHHTGANFVIRNATGGIYFQDSSVVPAQNRFVMDTLTGDFTATGEVTAYSDQRLKNNIRTIEDSVDLVKSMRGVRFEKDGKESVGVIAQEIQQVLPEVVKQNDEYLSVSYGNIVGVLIEAIKELTIKVETLEAKLEDKE